MPGYRIGIDVGGTFTDFLVVAPDGSLTLSKSFTTPDDQSRGVLEGLDRVAADAELSLPQLLAKTDLIIHGTTTRSIRTMSNPSLHEGRGRFWLWP